MSAGRGAGLPPVQRRKLAGDLRAAWGRCTIVVIALTLGVAAVTALLYAQQRLRAAMSGNYLATQPAHAQLVLDEVGDGLLDGVRSLPGVAAAEGGATVSTRLAAADGRWVPAMLFVVPVHAPPQVQRPRLEAGVWRADHDHLLIERDALPLLGAAVGQRLALDSGDGQPLSLRIAGSVHDPALAPASTEGVVWGYVGAELLARLPAWRPTRTLKLRFADVDELGDLGLAQARADRRAREVATALSRQGLRVVELRVPPTGRHPHQKQAEGAIAMLLAFGVLALGLCALLAATLMQGLLEQHRRQIGVMQTLGAGRGALLRLYGAYAAVLGVLAALLALPLGLAVGVVLSTVSERLLNLEPVQRAAPGWLLLATPLVALGLPLLAAAWPVWRAASTPVAATLARHTEIARPSAWDRALARHAGLPPALKLALRNLVRRRRRMALVVLLLASAGALFMGSLNLRRSWEALGERSAAQRHYTLELRLARPVSAADLSAALRAIPELRHAEVWNATSAVWMPDGQLPLARTYPDQGHGQLVLRGAPPATALVTHGLAAGRWFEAGDPTTPVAAGEPATPVVVNQAAWDLLPPGTALGQRVALFVAGQPRAVRLVGRLDEAMSPPTVYVSAGTFASWLELGDRATQLRLALHDPGATEAFAPVLSARLAASGWPVRRVVTESTLRAASSGHLRVLQRTLVAVAACVGIVGLMGLASALATGVVERRAELGVLRALGGSTGLLVGAVLAEALWTAAASALAALLLAWPIGALLARSIGELSAQPLAFAMAGSGVVAWLALLAGGTVLASGWPARQAAAVAVREALAERG